MSTRGPGNAVPGWMLSRRSFLNVLLGGGVLGWLAAVLYPVLRYLVPPEQAESEPSLVNLGRADAFPPGSSRIFKFGKRPVIVVRSNRGTFHALSATCTHLDCLVQYRSDKDAIWCACHNGRYDLSGRNIAGPPPKPLKQFVVKVLGGEVIVGKRSA